MTAGVSWESWKLAHAYHRIGSGTTPTSGNADYYDDVNGTPWITTSELRETYIERTSTNVTPLALNDFTTLRTYAPNSVFMAMYGATIGRLGISTIPATCNQACCVFEKSDRFDNRYLFYWLWHRRAELISLSVGGGQPNLSQQDLKSERALCPPLETQRRIAAFLDEKTAQIDGLIARKQALLERLAEKRQAIITQAVTMGLNSAVPVKDSGIDWLGQIPAHWEVKRLSFVTQVVDCKHRTPEYIDDGIPLVSTTEISPYQIDYQTKRQVSGEEMVIMSEGGRQPRISDIIYSRNASVGSAALVRSDRTICLGQDLCLVRPTSISPAFLEHFLNSTACLEQLSSHLVGATFKRVNVDVIKKYTLPLPPRDEQTAIVSFVDTQIAKSQIVERKVLSSIKALTEYRAALITAAVTGQIEGLQ